MTLWFARISILVVLLSACGQKGALYLPQEANEPAEVEETTPQN